MTRLADLQQPKGADILGPAWSKSIAAELAKVLAALKGETELGENYFALVDCLANLYGLLGGTTDAAGLPLNNGDAGLPYDDGMQVK